MKSIIKGCGSWQESQAPNRQSPHFFAKLALRGKPCIVREHVPQLDLGSDAVARTIGEGWGTSYFP